MHAPRNLHIDCGAVTEGTNKQSELQAINWFHCFTEYLNIQALYGQIKYGIQMRY